MTSVVVATSDDDWSTLEHYSALWARWRRWRHIHVFMVRDCASRERVRRGSSAALLLPTPTRASRR